MGIVVQERKQLIPSDMQCISQTVGTHVFAVQQAHRRTTYICRPGGFPHHWKPGAINQPQSVVPFVKHIWQTYGLIWV